MPSEATLAFGAELAGALLGLDVLYRSESEDPDGLVVVNLDGEGLCAPADFAGYDDADAAFRDLGARAAGLPEADRRLYYRQACRSARAFVAWRRGSLPFLRQLGDFLHVPAEPVPEAELEGICSELRSLLDGMGHRGSLTAQCAAWEERTRVPAGDVVAVLDGLLDEAWERTEERLLEIPAPRTDRMRAGAVAGVAFNARCDYLSRRIEVNTDPVLTRPGLKHLAAHEGCPGHYLQFKLREVMARRGEAPADVLLSVVNTASSSVFEGIADTGLEMLGWGDSDDDRVQALLNRHRAGLGVGAAWRLHHLGRPAGEVEDWLRERALVGGEGWVRNRMAFIAAPARAVLIWSYWWGERAVAPAWRAAPARVRQGFLQFLYGRMHSIDTVRMFPAP